MVSLTETYSPHILNLCMNISKTTEFKNISFLVLKVEMVRDKRKKGIKILEFSTTHI